MTDLLTVNEKQVIEQAFRRIDQNTDGILDHDEIRHCIMHLCDTTPSQAELEEMFQLAGAASTAGMSMQEFVNMIAVASEGSGKATKLGCLIHQNIHKVDTIEFKNERAKEMWERNHVHHKRPDMDYGSLSHFVDGDTVTCARCHKPFNAKENDDEACLFHPGKRIQEDSHTKGNFDTIRYTCCGGTELGMDHTIKATPGCKKGKHLNNEEFHAWLKSEGHR